MGEKFDLFRQLRLLEKRLGNRTPCEFPIRTMRAFIRVLPSLG